MLLKTSTITLCSGSGLSGLPASITSCNPTPRYQPPSINHRARRPQRRGFAAVLHDEHDPGRRDNEPSSTGSRPHWPASTNPTPYEIFNLARDSAYSKARFYELVKIYHPDRHHHTLHHGVPQTTKLERYRLVVAANDILCDPTKRRAYDLYGAGWGSQHPPQATPRTWDHSWRYQPGNASANGTWEDWERWYNERDGKKQQPVYMSNGGFVGVIFIFMFIGALGQISRMDHSSARVLEMREQKHAGISQELRKRQTDNAALNREERIDSFLMQREGWGYGAPIGHMHDSTQK